MAVITHNPAWTPRDVRRFSVRERRYWIEQWRFYTASIVEGSDT